MHNLYIDLDSLLDTRLGLFMSMSPELAAVIYNNNYVTRINDNFSLMGYLEFKERYKNRNKQVLKIPLPTMIIMFLEVHLTFLIQDNTYKGGDGYIDVYLNLYPYEFSTQEKNLIVNGFRSKLPKKVTVIPVFDENPQVSFIKEKIHTLVLYNGLDWVEHNVKHNKLQMGEINHVELIIPDIINTPVGVHLEKEKIINELTLSFLPFIDISFLDVGMFSTSIPNNNQ